MILEEATFEAFRYYPNDLKPQSGKPIIAICELCGEPKVTSKHDYYIFCILCSCKCRSAWNKSKTTPEEVRKKISENHADVSGAKNPNYGKTASDKTKRLQSEAHKSDKAFNYKDGLSITNPKEYMRSRRKTANGEKAIRKGDAKHKKLGFALLMPLKEGEVGHHITDKYVIGIPEEVHKKLSGYLRKKHRTKVLQWLKTNDKKKYRKVLCVLAKEPLHF